MYHIFLTHSVDGHLGCFYSLAIVHSAVMNTGVHVFFSAMFFSDYMPRNGIAGSSVLHTVFHSNCTNLHSLQESTRITPNCWTEINNNNKMLAPTNTPCVCCCAQLGLTLCDPMDCSPPASFVHGISQARIVEWVAISYSRGSSWPRDWTCVSCISCIGRQILYHCTTWQAQYTRIVLIRIRFCLLHPGLECIPPSEWLHEANHGYLQKTTTGLESLQGFMQHKWPLLHFIRFYFVLVS